MKRLVLGLAGGVGSGKSSVAAIFRRWGADVVDADVLGHRALEIPAVRSRLARAWGPGILKDGRVDRAALGRLAFRSKRDVARLNRLVHPAILREIRRRIARAGGWVVLDAALLFEAGADRLCDRVAFVDVPRHERIRRTRVRGWDARELARRERFQWPVSFKRRKADYVIDNAGPKSRTIEQARRIYEDLCPRP